MKKYLISKHNTNKHKLNKHKQSDKATQEQRLELCEKNGLSNQIDVEKMISCDTLVAIEPTKARICSFCGFGSAEQSEQCSLCDIGSV